MRCSQNELCSKNNMLKKETKCWQILVVLMVGCGVVWWAAVFLLLETSLLLYFLAKTFCATPGLLAVFLSSHFSSLCMRYLLGPPPLLLSLSIHSFESGDDPLSSELPFSKTENKKNFEVYGTKTGATPRILEKQLVNRIGLYNAP